jgi:hypothetical protein
LRLDYELHGDVQALRLPVRTQPSPARRLWRHTCFEAFIGAQGLPAYHEFNFSPSGQWAACAFDAERAPDDTRRLQNAAQPQIACSVLGDRLSLSVQVPPLWLPKRATGWQMGLCAVVEMQDGQLSYWALAHTATKPDFHRRSAWLLRIAPLPDAAS